MNKTKVVFILAAAAVLLACEMNKMPLPSPRIANASFGANDTSYVELNPLWSAEYLGVSLQAPGDLIMGPDGILYLADQGADRVHAFSKAGVRLTAHGFDQISGVPAPSGLALDSKLNLLIVNGTSTIYVWNQYLNLTAIDSVAHKGVYWERTKNDTLHLTLAQFQEQSASGVDLSLRYYLFEKNDAAAQAACRVTPLYQAPEADAQFNGVAAGKHGSNVFYVTESHYDRIYQLRLIPDLVLKGHGRQILYHYRARLEKVVASYGSGSGTVDNPWAITTDKDENIYFTQLSGNFKVQKLQAGSFAPRYVLYQHDIMDLDRFVAPRDVALDGAGNIFVMDAGTGSVSKFGNAGTAAGALLPLGKKGLAATLFVDGRGLLVSDNVVYVVEQSEKRIRRFQYSVSDSDLPDDEKKP